MHQSHMLDALEPYNFQFPFYKNDLNHNSPSINMRQLHTLYSLEPGDVWFIGFIRTKHQKGLQTFYTTLKSLVKNMACDVF